MIVEKIMTKDVFTLTPEHTLQDANQLMREKKIRHLPIINTEKQLVGLVAQRDIKNTITHLLNQDEEKKILQTPISEIMTKHPLVGHPLDFVEEVALLFYEHKIGCLPIISHKKLVGILTDSDLLYNYIELTGATKPSSRIDIRIKDEAGILHDITGVIAQYNANILSILLHPDISPNHQVISIRVKSMNPVPIIRALRKEGFDVLWPNTPGMDL